MPNRALIIYDCLPDPQEEAPAWAALASLGYTPARVSLCEGARAVEAAARAAQAGAGAGDQILVAYHGDGSPPEASEDGRWPGGASDLLGGAGVAPANRVTAERLFAWLAAGAQEGVTIVVITDSRSDGSFFELRNAATATAAPVRARGRGPGAFVYAPAEWGFTVACRPRPVHRTPAAMIVVIAPVGPGCICLRVVEYVASRRAAGGETRGAGRTVGEICKYVSASHYADDRPFPLAVACSGHCPLRSFLIII